MHLIDLSIHPLKSARGLMLDHAEVQPRGLAGDRRWMAIDGDGKFLSARSLPQMVMIDARLDPDTGALQLSAPAQTSVDVAEPPASQHCIDVEVWGSQCPARVADAAANLWISRVLGVDCRLVHMADDCLRAVSTTWSIAGDIVSFADGFPLLLIGTASLDELNRRASRPLTMQHFRPNLVVQTEQPFIEDSWQRVRIGAIEFDVCKPCTRCILTTVDPDTGIKASDGEPLATLKTFRRSDIGITFGQNLIPRSFGMLHRNDIVVAIR